MTVPTVRRSFILSCLPEEFCPRSDEAIQENAETCVRRASGGVLALAGCEHTEDGWDFVVAPVRDAPNEKVLAGLVGFSRSAEREVFGGSGNGGLDVTVEASWEINARDRFWQVWSAVERQMAKEDGPKLVASFYEPERAGGGERLVVSFFESTDAQSRRFGLAQSLGRYVAVDGVIQDAFDGPLRRDTPKSFSARLDAVAAANTAGRDEAMAILYQAVEDDRHRDALRQHEAYAVIQRTVKDRALKPQVR